MRKVAFLVACDECPEDPKIPKLLFPKSDAETLSEILADNETCGFEPHLYVNEPSYKVLEDLYDICGQLKPDDTLLFYYSGHGMRRGNELCLVSRNTKLARLIPTSIKAMEVLGYLRDSSAKRRILILDCCYSGVIGLQYKAADTDSSLDALGNDFGTCILTASTSIQLSEEREKDGHGLFTNALIDCLREPPKESINVDDWYLYAVDRLRVSESQRPTKCGYVEGHPIEIGNFRQRFARLRQQELEQLISKARDKLQPYVTVGALTEEQVESIVSDLQCDEARLLPYKRPFRQAVIRFVNGEAAFLEVFGAGYILRSEPPRKPPEDDVSPPITPPEAPSARPTVTPPEPAVVEKPVSPAEPLATDQPTGPAASLRDGVFEERGAIPSETPSRVNQAIERAFFGEKPDFDLSLSSTLRHNWTVVAARGVFGIIIGLIAFLFPGPTLLSLVGLFAVFLIIDGILAIVAAVRAANKNQRWGFLTFEGIVAGIVAMAMPGLTVYVFVGLLAAWALVSGALELRAASNLAKDHGRWWLALGGIISIVFGIVLVAVLVFGSFHVTWFFGAYPTFFGATLLALAFKLRAVGLVGNGGSD